MNRNHIIFGALIALLLIGGLYLGQQKLFTNSTRPAANEQIPLPTTNVNENNDVVPEEMEVAIGLIAVDDGGVQGRMIGCNDSVVLVPRTVPYSRGTLRAALEELLSLVEANEPSTEFYNALYQSNLVIENVAIEDSIATIELTGDILVGGVCDEPRVEAQLRETALQFSTVEAVEIFINGESIEAVFSAQ